VSSGGRSAPVSLPRALSKLGLCSRAQAEVAVRAGRVTVNGIVRRDPTIRVDMDRDRIALDGEAAVARRRVYLALNKPRGLVTTRDDPQGRETVFACLAGADLPPVNAVGRLDKASEGLLLLTNDTRWGQRILDPATHLPKTYHVQVSVVPDDALVARLREGVTDEGEKLAVRDAAVLRAGERHGWLEVVLDEGRNRHIRRLLAALDVEVLRLVRVAIGPLALGDLPKGGFRHLTRAEQAALDRAMDRR
jgi:23S rRNA pseudouridine2605 synthase